ncbi:hypothetical protein INS49_015431 [Diaporthe citri]|uniref:uncharacterized protein n=1 Tax=Diaporthe citri TaxID=83186 RepID=UPI001C80C9EF|nr:uncharacterized protein INS49_015431 [Diaporthe citri]KAG6356046.1 hypothetical protein INS49_015431 [Diaporthe citri]
MGSSPAMESLLRRVDTNNIVDTRQMSSGERFLVACFLGAAIWNAVGMFPMIFLTFKRLWTLYFWAMILSTIGILICSASQIISVATPQVNTMINGVMSCVGWVFMVSGQSVVLYSRLHLLAITPRVLRLVLWMIIINGVTIHVTGTVLTVGTRLKGPDVFERINITVFFAQETVISGLYMWKSRDLLGRYSKPRAAEEPSIRQYASPRVSTSLRVVKSILTQLIIVNIIILFLDITIVVLEHAGLYLIQLGYKIFVYSVKLRITDASPPSRYHAVDTRAECEITILNRLLDFANRSRRLNTEFQLVTDLQREWDSTLERAFGTQTSADIGTGSTSTRNNQYTNTRESSGSRVSQEKWLERQESNITET